MSTKYESWEKEKKKKPTEKKKEKKSRQSTEKYQDGFRRSQKIISRMEYYLFSKKTIYQSSDSAVNEAVLMTDCTVNFHR